MNENTIEERELGWEDTIQKDALEFEPLPEGDYEFTVESFERGRHNGSEKLRPCNKAILKLRVKAQTAARLQSLTTCSCTQEPKACYPHSSRASGRRKRENRSA